MTSTRNKSDGVSAGSCMRSSLATKVARATPTSSMRVRRTDSWRWLWPWSPEGCCGCGCKGSTEDMFSVSGVQKQWITGYASCAVSSTATADTCSQMPPVARVRVPLTGVWHRTKRALRTTSPSEERRGLLYRQRGGLPPSRLVDVVSAARRETLTRVARPLDTASEPASPPSTYHGMLAAAASVQLPPKLW